MLIQENSLSKKKSFNAADGVKPKTAPPKPMRGLDKINEDGSPPPLPSRNVIGSPGQPSNKPSNQPSNQQKGNLQQRPLPKIPTPPSEPPSTQGSGQYVCDTDLALGLCVYVYVCACVCACVCLWGVWVGVCKCGWMWIMKIKCVFAYSVRITALVL